MSQGNPMSSFSHTWEIARSDLNNVCWLDVCKKRWSCSNSWMSTSSMLSLPLHCIGEKKLPQFSKSQQSQLNLMIENTFNLERRGKKDFPRWQHWCHLQRSSWQKPKNNWRDIHSTTVVDTLRIHASWIHASWMLASWIHALWILSSWIQTSWIHTSLTHTGHLRGSHSLSDRRARKMKSSCPKGPEAQRRTLRLLHSLTYCFCFIRRNNPLLGQCCSTGITQRGAADKARGLCGLQADTKKVSTPEESLKRKSTGGHSWPCLAFIGNEYCDGSLYKW